MFYVVELKDGYYYYSKYPLESLKSSQMNNWTKLHPPVKTIKSMCVDEETFDDDSFVLNLMEKYGVDKVRGGSFISIELSDYQKRIIDKRLNKVVQPKVVEEERYNNSNLLLSYQESNNEDDDFHKVNYSSRKINSSYNRIGKDYSMNIDNPKSYICSYCEMSFDLADAWRKHEEHCKDSYYTKPRGKGTHCTKCGRDTHIAQFCRASTNILGHPI